MKLFIIKAEYVGWDEYSSVLVAAESAKSALEYVQSENTSQPQPNSPNWEYYFPLFKENQGKLMVKEIGYANADCEKGVLMDDFLNG